MPTFMCQNAYKRMWILRRLKTLGASITDLISVYTSQIRCTVEFAVAVWNSALTDAQICQLERIQRCALSIILADHYRDYKTALSKSNLEVLTVRRKKLCLKFAAKSANHPKFASCCLIEISHIDCQEITTGVDITLCFCVMIRIISLPQ